MKDYRINRKISMHSYCRLISNYTRNTWTQFGCTYMYIKHRYNTNTKNITIMASLMHVKQQRNQHFIRKEKGRSSFRYALHTYNTSALTRHEIKKENHK